MGSQKDEESYGDGLCREGSKGPLCTVCEHDHYFSMTGLQCEKCPRARERALPTHLSLVVET